MVLALDDEPSIRAFMRKALSRRRNGLPALPDGAQALEGLRETAFDVMLIDHRMAGMSGTEFYEAAVEFRPELARRAIFMSGDVLNPDLRGFATQRGIRLLAKPFDIDAVIRIVKEARADADEADALAGSDGQLDLRDAPLVRTMRSRRRSAAAYGSSSVRGHGPEQLLGYRCCLEGAPPARGACPKARPRSELRP